MKKSAKKLAKKSAKKKSATKTKPANRKIVSARAASKPKKKARPKNQSVNRVSSRGDRDARSGQLSGDLQGLSNRERADSESVDELLEEGNAFEADVVSGVEDADNADEREVHTHEVPEDDVPEEYLDKE